MQSIARFSFLVFLIACGQKSNTPAALPHNTDGNLNNEVATIPTNDSAKAPMQTLGNGWAGYSVVANSDAEQLCLDFMTWYLNIYNNDTNTFLCKAVANDQGGYRVDARAYLGRLQHTGWFSPQFFKGEKERIKNCNQLLANLDASKQTALEVEGAACNRLKEFEWIGGQNEAFTNCAIETSKGQKNIDQSEKTQVILMIGTEDFPYSRTEIICTPVNHKWLIDKVELISILAR